MKARELIFLGRIEMINTSYRGVVLEPLCCGASVKLVQFIATEIIE